MKKFKKIMVVVLLLALCITTVTGSGTTYELEEVYYPIYANGKELPRGDLPILNYNGSTYVPLRKLSEAARVEIEWDNTSNSVEIRNIYKAAYYLYKIIMVEQRAELALERTMKYTDKFEGLVSLYVVDKAITKDEALTALDMWHGYLENDLQDYQSLLTDLFPNGLDTSIEYENELNEYITGVNYMISLFAEMYSYAKGCIEGMYTYDFYMSQWKRIHLSSDIPNFYEHSQSDGFFQMLNEVGY